MALTETVFNVALANVLNRVSQQWEVTAERTGVLSESSGLTIDVLIRGKNRTPLVIENEYVPASNVEADARSRLGKTFSFDGSSVTQVVALRTPASLKECKTAQEAEILMQSCEFEYAILRDRSQTVSDDFVSFEVQRVPEIPSAFISGSIQALASFLATATFNNLALSESIEELNRGVQESINILQDVARSSDEFKIQLSNLMMRAFSDKDVSQGLGIAATVVINATLFQQKLATRYEGIRTLAQMQGNDDLNQAGLLKQWRQILQINYWPIYSIAISVLAAIKDPYVVSKFINRLSKTTQNLVDLGVVETHDLCGVVFQQFMTERKNLASYYTRPSSATLLAHLAIPDQDWSDTSVYKNFKFADYSCGTGALVHAVYRKITSLHEFEGGSPASLHAHMMENSITAADIVPSATHLTATLLSSLFPNETYESSRVLIPEYGLVDDGATVRLGSLEILDDESVFRNMFPNAPDARALDASGSQNRTYEFLIQRASQDLVIMNPPYTRAMSDWVEKAQGTWKPYNVLGNSAETQARMKKREGQLTNKIRCYNGYQSMPSAFCGVADLMLKEDGILALVLPLTALQGVSWHRFREMLAFDYAEVTVISISQDSAGKCAWSADTKLAEVLITARKKTAAEKSDSSAPETRGTIINLYNRPDNNLIAEQLAEQIKKVLHRRQLRSLEDGPYGGTPLIVAGEHAGEVLSVPMSAKSWEVLGIRDLSLAQFAFHLSHGRVWFPRSSKPLDRVLPIRRIREFARVGFADNNIANNKKAAFERIDDISATADYPMMWRNESNDQRSMTLTPDQEGRVRPDREELASRIWACRSHALIAREVSFGSQSLVSGFTEKVVIGGRAWPNIQLLDERLEKAFVLWGNTTLGALSYWFHCSRQQVKRGIVTVTSIADLPWLDPTALNPEALQYAVDLFDEFRTHPLLPLGQAYRDPTRQALDKRFLSEVLGFSRSATQQFQHLVQKWCAEPSLS